MNAVRRPPARAGGRRGEFSKRYAPRRKVCTFCVDKIKYIDYKDIPRLRRHLSERGKIEPRRKTGTCAKHQRALAVALKRARHVALLPFTAEHIRLSGMILRSPDDRRRDDRGPRRDMPPRVDAAAPAPSADGAPAVGTPALGVPGAEGAPVAGVPTIEGAPATASATDGAPAAPATDVAPSAAPAAPEAPTNGSAAPAAGDAAPSNGAGLSTGDAAPVASSDATPAPAESTTTE